MASNVEDVSERNCSDFSDTETQSQSDSDSDTTPQQQVCRYYNKGHCHNGSRCKDLHVCQYYLKGNCRYGASCRLSHILNTSLPSLAENQETRHHGRRSHGHRERRRSSSSDSDMDSSRPYRWQLNLGKGWEDVANDYILEAQYSQPNTKGIRLYNTPCGVLSIDFTHMCILNKTNLRVRRKGSQQNEWQWYFHGNHGWYLYGTKNAQGSISSVSSSRLETEYKKNQHGSVQFNVNSTNYEIRFKDMCQKNLSTGHKRRVRRRPKYVHHSTGGINKLTHIFKRPFLSTATPVWQFSGKSGNWHNFKSHGSCTVSSSDIEAEYQRNKQGSLSFTVNGDQYILDFSRMIQTNQRTRASREVRRVMQ